MGRLRRLIPRFSLRTLAVFLLLVTSGAGLWWHWEAWYKCLPLGPGTGRHEGFNWRYYGRPRTERVFLERRPPRPDDDDGVHLTGTRGEILTWDGRSGMGGLTVLAEVRGNCGAVPSPDGRRFLITSPGGPGKVLDASSGEVLSVLGGAEAERAPDAEGSRAREYDRAVWSPDGSRVLATTHRMLLSPRSGYTPAGKYIKRWDYQNRITVRAWNAETGELLCRREIHAVDVRLHFSPDSSRVMLLCGNSNEEVWGKDDGMVHVWDARTMDHLFPLVGHEGKVHRWTGWSPDSTRMLTGGADGTVRVWDAVTGRCILVMTCSDGPVADAELSPDGERLITRGKSPFLLWNPKTGERIAEMEDPYGGMCRFSPDGGLIVGPGEDAQVRVWSAEDGALLSAFGDNSTEKIGFGSLPGGARVYVEDMGPAVRIFDARSGRLLAVLEGCESEMQPTGQRIVTIDETGTAFVWDGRTSQLLAVLENETGTPGLATLLPSAESIVIDYQDERVVIWNRRRPERWWGVFYLWEFWLTVAFAGLFVWSVWRDRRALAKG